MIEKIQEKIDKCEKLEQEAGSSAEDDLVKGFLGDLTDLLVFAREKKACCESKVKYLLLSKYGKVIQITRCRDCPWITRHGNLPDECTKYNLRIENYDEVHPGCNLHDNK